MRIVPKEEIRTNKTKVIILSIALGIFLCLGFVAMSFVYKMDIKKAIRSTPKLDGHNEKVYKLPMNKKEKNS